MRSAVASGPLPPTVSPASGNGGTTQGRSGLRTQAGYAIRLVISIALVAFFVSQSFYDHAADFKSFYSAGNAVRNPEIPLYDVVALDENPFGEVFKLPPSAAVYLVPVSFGTVQQARLAWRLLLVAAVMAAYAILARTFGVRLLCTAWLAGLAIWSVFGPLQIAVGEGQWDPIFLLLIVLTTAGAAQSRPLLAALPVAVAATIKPYPLVLAGYFVARRWWRPLLVTLAATVLLLVASAAIVGRDETQVFLTRVLPASGVTTAYADNQALGGVIARLVTNDHKPVPLHDAGTVDLAIRAVALVALAVTVWLVARSHDGDSMTRGLQLGLFVPLSILIVPAAWTHYQTILLVPLSLLALDRLRRDPRNVPGWVALAVTALLLALPNPSMLYGAEVERNLWLRSRADGANLALERMYPDALSRLVLSYKTFAILALYGLTAWRIARPQPSAVTGSVEAPTPVSTPDVVAE
jgi:alpha-1,2-mannosyltransferase